MPGTYVDWYYDPNTGEIIEFYLFDRFWRGASENLTALQLEEMKTHNAYAEIVKSHGEFEYYATTVYGDAAPSPPGALSALWALLRFLFWTVVIIGGGIALILSTWRVMDWWDYTIRPLLIGLW